MDLKNSQEDAKNLGEKLKDVANDAAFTENALKSIAQTFKDAISEAIESTGGLDTATKKVGASISRDIVNGIKKLGPSLEKSISLQQKLSEGQDITADLLKEQQKTQATRVAVEARILQLKNEGIATDDLEVALLSQIALEEEEILRLQNEQTQQSQINSNTIDEKNRLLGVSGGVLKGLNSIAGKFTKAFNLDKVATDMDKVAASIAKGEKAGNRLTVVMAGIGSATKNAFSTLTDPAVIIGSLIKGFTAVDKQAVSFQRMTGQNMNTMATSAAAANTHFTTLADYIKTAGELTAELGMNANNILSPQDIQEASEMAHAMGMTGEEAAKITKISTTNGKSLRENNEAIVDSVNSFNKQNKTAVMSSKIFKDIANVSDEIAILYTGYPEKLASAAAAANSIGMELGDVANIASNLLDFQSSIESEMEAELLTGQALNLEKARSLALSNDLEGLAKEIANQGITSASFAALSAKGQAAQAKALGMSTAQMSKMLIQQGLTVGMSEEGLSDAQKQELSLMKQEEAQEKITKAIEKMQQVFAPIVEVVADVLTGFLGIVSGAFQLLGYLGLAKPLMYAIVGAIAISKFTSMAKAAGEFKDNLKGGLKIAGDLGKKIFGVGKGTKDVAGSVGEGASKVSSTAGEGMDKAGESIGKSADKTKDVKGDKGEDIKKFIIGVVDGLKYAGENFAMVVAGGAALLLSTPGLIGLGIASPGLFIISKINGESFSNAMKGIANGIIAFGSNFGKLMMGTVALGAVGLVLGGAFALAMQMVSGVDPVQMIAFAGSLTLLGLTVALLGNIGPMVMTGALAMGVLALSLIPAAYAFSLLAGVDAGSMFAFAGALSILGLAAAGLGFLTPFIIGGAFALGVLGLALIPMGEALSNLQGVDVSVIMSFVGGVSALSLMAAGLGFLSPFIIAGSIALAFLGASLIPLAMGMERMASVDSEGMINSLVQLSMVAPGLFSTAAALYAVAGGFAAVGVAGYLALPALAAMSLFGTNESTEVENTEDSGMAKVNANLEKLISLVEAGGDVFIDGAKVGKTIQLASSKMG
jgi:hypothetical protein